MRPWTTTPTTLGSTSKSSLPSGGAKSPSRPTASSRAITTLEVVFGDDVDIYCETSSVGRASNRLWTFSNNSANERVSLTCVRDVVLAFVDSIIHLAWFASRRGHRSPCEPFRQTSEPVAWNRRGRNKLFRRASSRGQGRGEDAGDRGPIRRHPIGLVRSTSPQNWGSFRIRSPGRTECP